MEASGNAVLYMEANGSTISNNVRRTYRERIRLSDVDSGAADPNVLYPCALSLPNGKRGRWCNVRVVPVAICCV